MKTLISVLLGLILLAGYSSCKRIDERTAFTDSIRIQISEDLDNGERILRLVCMTEEIYPCINYHLNSTLSVEDRKIRLGFYEVTEPGTCLTAIGPATSVYRIPNLKNGDYQIELALASGSISGQFTVTDQQYKITLPANQSFRIEPPVLNRVPANTIYGYVAYDTNTSANIAQLFIDSLQSLGAQYRSFLPGDYVHFKIDNKGAIEQGQNTGYRLASHFIYHYEGSLLELINFIRAFNVRHPSLLHIKVYTSNGELFR